MSDAGDTCTCAGTAPGYPQHQSGCGQPEGCEACWERDCGKCEAYGLQPYRGCCCGELIAEPATREGQQ